MAEPENPRSPVLPLEDAARYVGRTPNAMRILRHRHRGPKCFLQDGRLMYYVVHLNEWLAEAAAADPRFNPALDPTRVPPQAKRPRKAVVKKVSSTAPAASR